MNASCKGAQNTRLWNIHHAQLEPILWATSGHGGLFFCVWHVIMCMQAPVSYDKQNSFSHLFISARGRKQPERERKNPPKRLFILFAQHLAALNESISLQSPVSVPFQLAFTLPRHASSAHWQEWENKRKKWSSSALVAAQDPAFGSQQRSQGKICPGIRA